MITCPSCGTQNPDTGKFCISCGVDLTATATEEKLMTDSVATASEEAPTVVAASPVAEVPPEYVSPPPPEPIPAPPPLTPPGPSPQPSYSTVYPTPAAAKDRTIALVLEVLPGIFGFLGIGWMYGGNIGVGLAFLLGVLMWNVIGIVVAVFTLGFSLCCTIPVTWALTGVSAYFLNEYTKSSPDFRS